MQFKPFADIVPRSPSRPGSGHQGFVCVHIGIVVRISEGGQYLQLLCSGILSKYLQNLVWMAGENNPLEEMFSPMRIGYADRCFPRGRISATLNGLHSMVET